MLEYNQQQADIRQCNYLAVNRFGKQDCDGKGRAQDSIKFTEGMSVKLPWIAPRVRRGGIVRLPRSPAQTRVRQPSAISPTRYVPPEPCLPSRFRTRMRAMACSEQACKVRGPRS